MEEKKIKIQVKQLNKNIDIEINDQKSVLDLKNLIRQQIGAQSEDQKIVFRGKILKDTDQLAECKITNESAVHLVVCKPKETAQQQQTSEQQTSNEQPSLPNIQQSQQTVPNLQTGGSQGLSQFGFAGTNNMDPNLINQYMNNPMMNQMMQNMLQNPQMLQQMIQSNPMLQNMVQENPELLGALQDPSMLSMMRDPQMINSAIQMMSRMQNGTQQVGTMQGSNLPRPGNVQEQQSNQSQPNPVQNQQGQPNNNLNNPLLFGQNFGINQNQESTNSNLNQTGQQNPFLLGQNMGFQSNPYQRLQMLQQNPQLMQQVQQIMSNPQQMQMIMQMMGGLQQQQQPNQFDQSNPFQSNLGAQNPLLYNPQMMQQMMQMMYGNGSQNLSQTQTNNQTPEERFKDQLQSLNEMGFTNTQNNIQALIRTNGNVEAAVERLLQM